MFQWSNDQGDMGLSPTCGVESDTFGQIWWKKMTLCDDFVSVIQYKIIVFISKMSQHLKCSMFLLLFFDNLVVYK